MNIIDHLSIGVPDLIQAIDFYDGLMEKLGNKRLATSLDFAAYGKDTVQFLLMLPANGKTYSKANGTHICFSAETKDAVDAFHVFAIANGGQCDGQPGARSGYPIPNVYTTFVRDPFGHKLEAIFNGFSTY
jgi:catechol 2,3-dioxygenase-like lactoylglutathione lyase family enzyme